MTSQDKTLNPNQKKVVTHKQGPLLVVAGAGTGKTTTIIERIKYLISEKNTNPSNIFAATFTQKSADEMVERLDQIMPLSYEDPWIGTFHSLCDRILREDGFHIGIDPNYQIITSTQQWVLIKNHIFDLGLDHFRPLGNPNTFISELIKFFSRLQDEDVTPDQFINYSKKQEKKSIDQIEKEKSSHMLEISTAFKKYHQLKIEKSLFDFGDLITQTLFLFRFNPSILKKYQEIFKHILIDEFQDTNYAQYQFIKLLSPAKSNPNLIVVGDDDQSIYKFRGAAISNILGFKKDYPQAKNTVLTKNYRSVQKILDHAYQLIQHNNPDRLEVKLKINKKLTSLRKEANTSQFIFSTQSSQSEVDLIIEKIIHLVSTKKYTFKDFAILTRANNQLDPFVAALKNQGIPYQRIGNRGLFDQEEIKSLLDFLFVLSDPQDSASLFHFLNQDFFNIDTNSSIKMLNESKKRSIPLLNVLKENSSKDINLKKAVSLIDKFQDFSTHNPTTKVLHEYIIHTNYIQTLTREESVENTLKIKNINLFFDYIKNFEAKEKNNSVINFIEILTQWMEAGENPAQATIEDIDTVNLLTIHASKGLEFPVVFIPSMISGRFPTANRRDRIEFPNQLIKETLPEGNYHTEEERRLLYVAMTRARDFLFLSYASDYGGVRKRKPSGFLQETKLQTKEHTPKELFSNHPTSPVVPTYINKHKNIIIKSLSYTQIDTFKGCPLKYKYRYILKVPTLPYQSLTFGRSIHQTLHDFHRLTQQGQKPTQVDLINIYKNNFDETGYDSPKHKQERYQKGIKDLKKYYKNHNQLFGKPTHLERSFKFKIDDIVINGKIDRIDVHHDKTIEIIDYKTGKSKDQKSADRDGQLSLYALASKEVFKLNPDKLSLYYVESGEKITTTRSPEKLKKVKNQLKKDIQKLKSSDFKATPNPIRCKFCEYNRICPFAAK